MASTNKTPHYQLPQYIATDKPSYLGDANQAYLDIDTGIFEALTAGQTGQSVANSALGAAESARTAAESAEATAESAVAKAGEAQTAATQAMTTATEAQTTATNAATAAGKAQTTADGAKTVADSAQSAATAAAGAASTAQTRADSAYTLAQGASTTAGNASNRTTFEFIPFTGATGWTWTDFITDSSGFFRHGSTTGGGGQMPTFMQINGFIDKVSGSGLASQEVMLTVPTGAPVPSGSKWVNDSPIRLWYLQAGQWLEAQANSVSFKYNSATNTYDLTNNGAAIAGTQFELHCDAVITNLN